MIIWITIRSELRFAYNNTHSFMCVCAFFIIIWDLLYYCHLYFKVNILNGKLLCIVIMLQLPACLPAADAWFRIILYTWELEIKRTKKKTIKTNRIKMNSQQNNAPIKEGNLWNLGKKWENNYLLGWNHMATREDLFSLCNTVPRLFCCTYHLFNSFWTFFLFVIPPRTYSNCIWFANKFRSFC